MKTILLIDFENIQDVPLKAIDPKSTEVRVYVGKSQNRVPFELVSAAQRFGEAFSWHKIAGEGKNNLDFHIAFELGQLSARSDRDCEYVILSRDTGYDRLLEYARGLGIHCRRIRNIADLNQTGQGGRRRNQATDRETGRASTSRAQPAERSSGRSTSVSVRGGQRERGGPSRRGRLAGGGSSAAAASISGTSNGDRAAGMGLTADPTAARIIAAGGLLAELLVNLQRLPPNRRPRSRERLAKYLESTFRGRAEPERLKETIERLFLEGLLQEDNRKIRYSI